ncbi:tryptophan 7-halogenase [Pseudoalteromonas sp. Of7M-16]|uniref:NAD(P)/FAD-dependent oxidoreductase n=1 Tax=Pseudoalteromonas sp. Of7M-16 TaxID=2917756 RepID=UPI001EF44860|nr:tryptophan 7-halogenase [Pseudoalteromonas sp. Of7M-16]MCG7546629.1 tryptophan 7-halogenase [Pseudoalteromonas sp. Of7M-16]
MPNYECDLVIVGSGPAGLAAALCALKSNLSVILVEPRVFPRYRHGESLHPGVEPVLQHLGAGSLLSNGEFIRYLGIWSGSSTDLTYHKLGSDDEGDWRGYQIMGAEFDAELQKLAVQRGAKLIADRAHSVVRKGERVAGVRTVGGLQIRAKFTLDAAGGRHWLANQLNIEVEPFSPPLVSTSEYGSLSSEGEQVAQLPRFEFDENGWTWTAEVERKMYCVTRLNWHTNLNKKPEKTYSKTLNSTTKVRASNVTWRCAQRLAGAGFFILGDAAMVLDPASSQGVIRALTSGVTAVELIKVLLFEPEQEASLYQTYTDKMQWQFHDSRRSLIKHYRQSPSCPYWLSAQ